MDDLHTIPELSPRDIEDVKQAGEAMSQLAMLRGSAWAARGDNVNDGSISAKVVMGVTYGLALVINKLAKDGHGEHLAETVHEAVLSHLRNFAEADAGQRGEDGEFEQFEREGPDTTDAEIGIDVI